EPQVPFASLTMLLGYVLGPLAGIVAGTLVYLVVGWAGCYLYSGLWLEQPRARALAASLFIGNGFFICRISHGHLDFMPFLALPLQPAPDRVRGRLWTGRAPGRRVPVADALGPSRFPTPDRRHLHGTLVATVVHVDSHARQDPAGKRHRHRAQRIHRTVSRSP